MIQRALASKGLVAYILACATGITLYFRWPFPENDLMLHLISIRAPLIYDGFRYTYTLFLFTTPYIAYSLVLSGLYVFALRPTRKIKPMPLPAFPEPSKRNELFLVLGEVHDPRRAVAAEHPHWLTVPERGLFTGIAIFGAIGSGKTSGCMYPYAEQLITTSIAALLFLSAGTIRIASIRNYLVAFSILLLFTMLAVDPGLAQERAHPKEPRTSDSRLAAGLLFVVTLAVASFSVGHLPSRFNVPVAIRYSALGLFILGTALQTWAMIVNPFFSPVVRLQSERGHHLITTGPYKFIRHPGYLAMLISVPCSALAIGSWVAVVPASRFVTLMFRRMITEDAFLRNNLCDYATYSEHVTSRVVPRIALRKALAHARSKSVEEFTCNHEVSKK